MAGLGKRLMAGSFHKMGHMTNKSGMLTRTARNVAAVVDERGKDENNPAHWLIAAFLCV